MQVRERAGEVNAGTSIYRSTEAKARVLNLYDEILDRWPVPHKSLYLSTGYGRVHVLVSGPAAGEPLMLFHAASMAAISWAPNVGALTEAGFRSYAVDYIGEANRSELSDLTTYPRNSRQITDLYSDIANQLGVERAPIIAASAGGHVALRYALAYPERVPRLALLGPMGVTRLGLRAMLRMMMVSMFPSERRIGSTTRWALGSDPETLRQYGPWFREVLRAVASPPRVARPVALKPEEQRRLPMPVLLVLGDADKLVGNPEGARRRAGHIPNLSVEVVQSAHLVGVERAAEVNPMLVEFLERGES